jgi:hypothetical protein
MQKRIRRCALFLGGVSIVSVSILIGACGTDNGQTSGGLPTVEAGKDGGPRPETGPDPDGAVDAGPEADCTKAPVLRTHTPTTGFFCSFYRRDGGAGDAGGLGASYCPADGTCCNPGDNPAGSGTFPTSFCSIGKGEDSCAAEAIANGSTWRADAGSAWECADNVQCAGGEVCCLIQDPARLAADPSGNKLNIGKFPASNKDVPPACNAQMAYNSGGSRCRATCLAGEYKLCSLNDTTCGAGQTCTPDEALYRDLGACK